MQNNKNDRSLEALAGIRLSRAGIWLLIVVCCLLARGSGSLAAQQGKDVRAQRYVTIDFNDVDINLLIKYISELTGKNFIVDRAVKGNVSIISPTKISEEDAYRVFLSVLDVYGYTTVQSGSVIKILPAVQARVKNIETIRDSSGLAPEDKVVTQLIQLTYSDPDDVKKILSPLISNTSVVISHTESGMLIITDTMSNLQRLSEIIRAIDVPSVDEEMVVLPLEHATAEAVAKSLGQIFLQTAKKTGPGDLVKIIPYERNNSLILLASKTNLAKIKQIVAQLDVLVPRGEGRIQVHYLQHAKAEEIVKVLTSLATTEKGAQPNGKAPLLSKDVAIMADTATNSLVIVASRDEYPVIEDVIKKLDIPRRMVYIEALIMEVKVDKSFEVGVQWAGAGSFQDETGRLFSGFSGNPSDPYDALQGIQNDPPVFPSGFLFGVMKEGVKIGDVFFPNLGAVLKAYKDDSDVNIIATPQILTTDNQKAEIHVGENVPYITSKNTTDTLQDYTNYEYKDVSTSLEITPQINREDLVRLEIATEVIKLKDPNSLSETPTTLKRTAKTTVIIHDRETVVIGGIIGQDTSAGEFKVPILGDIPLLGWLFKTHSQFDERTNLFIFITPRIVENPAELASLYQKKRQDITRAQAGDREPLVWEPQPGPDQDNAIYLSDIGFSKLQNKEYDKAKQYFEEALKSDPENTNAYINLGVVLEQEGNKEQAAGMYRRAIELVRKHEGDVERHDSHLLGVAQENLQKLEQDTLPAPAPTESR